MRWAQRGGTIPESTQEVIGYRPSEAGSRIHDAVDRYALRVVAVFATNTGATEAEQTVWVVYEEAA